MGESSSSIDIFELIKKRLSLINSNPSSTMPTCCIYRVDKRIRKMNEDAYTPDTVSIGPYHRNNQNLQMQAMEDLKTRYVQSLLVRTRTSLETYVEALKELETETRKCYSEPINLSNKEESLVAIMLFDGLFIIELFQKYAQNVNPDVDDPVFYSKLMRTRIVRDLVLLENQIPMSVLRKLFDLNKDPNSDTLSLVDLALHFFDDLIPDAMFNYPPNPENKHLLDLLSYRLEGSLSTDTTMPTSNTETLEFLPCVTELRHSGVKFMKSLNYGSLMDIKFSSEGVFEIPPLCVDDYTFIFPEPYCLRATM